MRNKTDYWQSVQLVQAGYSPQTADYFFYKDSVGSGGQKKRYEPYFPYVPCWGVINAIRCDKILVEFLRVNSWIKKWLTNLGSGVDLTAYTEYHSGYSHLPLSRKKELMAGITGFREVSVCEDVEEHQDYWAGNVNHNPDDCCNLRV